jgi:kinetochore protein Mis12/MTW1
MMLPDAFPALPHTTIMASRANNAGPSNLNNGHSAKGLDASTSERPNNTDLLVPELFGFEPIHLLDDIFNVAQDAVIFSTEAMDKFLTGWSGRRREVRAEQGLPPLKAPNGEEWTGEEEIEQGLVSLQTLLDTHVDEVFDMFEVWALRNVFKVPDDAEQVVLPHHKGLDLNVREGKEAELLAEIEELRRKKENVRAALSFQFL